ncbi:protein DOUBLE-STRAND BREAK FORMATION isoform X1 [Syzygium oleosum]|uniref:protein DOUBLE-STRAND BREAK FORMATION isoform X1 n=1 Tax=Syzygium oleosum TaxID=219896 RepID=UPI0011D2303F|nr:protein DOUBLE-STRAND BREAK FORMATION isoform X1 [Syzygium oleosum]
MADALSPPEVSLFLFLVKLRRFDDATLGVLRTLLVSKDARSAVQARSSLERFMRFESLRILREVADKDAVHVLSVLEFLVRAFAVIGDFESCLALRYEALVFRENKSGVHQWLQVGHTEWVNFAKDALDNGFYPIATKACENALLCLQRSDTSGLENFTGDIQNIVSLKDVAISSTGSCSVQAKAVKYLKRKEMERSKQQASTFREIQPVASVLFRDSIKKRNARIFSECQALRSAARNSHAHTKIPGFV